MNNTLSKIGSYPEQDVTFLLKDLSHIELEKSTMEREQSIQSGVHYSEMLPIEYKPLDEYMELFFDSLERSKEKVALSVALVAEQIVMRKGHNIVLCSLARAGTPIGVLIRRYIEFKYQISIPHFSISIIRGKGIDENALKFISSKYPEHTIVFVDGWTGKGAITKELDTSVKSFNQKYNKQLSSELAVLADPGYCSSLYGTREDFLIPSACLNSIVSGLVSRTVANDLWIGPKDFHGAKYYKEWLSEDVSTFFVDTISAEFQSILSKVDSELKPLLEAHEEPTWNGLKSVEKIQQEFKIDNLNYIKPGVGETTRVLLRRVPWKILINPSERHHLEHILLLAKERGVPIQEYTGMSYSCCGLIKQLEKNT
ncbi:cysteine protease StiP family protein [Bacillus sp. DJP31]|uniref:cysteine protease StiP family protein n=1 Tax=Bacillus sp. DJP31 TaxID=3409789 RepID=UPI003BB571F8